MRRNVHVAFRQKNGLPWPSRIYKESEVLNQVKNYFSQPTLCAIKTKELRRGFIFYTQ